MITKLTRHQLNQDRARLEEFIQSRKEAYAKNCAPTEAQKALREENEAHLIQEAILGLA